MMTGFQAIPPTVLALLYVIGGFIWLLAGAPLVFPHLLKPGLFVVASGALFYGLLRFQARTT